jgi:protein TonB
VDPTPTPAPSEEQLAARLQEQYRLQLLAAARRHNRYPRLARENNWEGEVQVSVTVAADGSASVRIKDSSGHAVLDRQAMEMFERAQAAVPVPAALRGKQFSLDLKARYSLRDQVSG